MLYTGHKAHTNFDFWKFKSFFSSFKRGANAFLHSLHVVKVLVKETSDHWLPRIFKLAVLISLIQTFHAEDRQHNQSSFD